MKNRLDAIAYDLVDGLGRWKSQQMLHFNINPPLTDEEMGDLEQAIITQFKAHKVEPMDFQIAMKTDRTAVAIKIFKPMES